MKNNESQKKTIFPTPNSGRQIKTIMNRFMPSGLACNSTNHNS